MALLLGSANRDERVFADPDRFDVAREPRGHLAFGFGPHFCMGAALARLEAKVALEALTAELPRCKPVGGPPPMVEAALALLERKGVPESQVHYDKFTTTEQ